MKNTEILRRVVEDTSTTTGTAFFRSLVRTLAKTLDVRYCLLANCREEAPEIVRTLAFWNGDHFADQFEYTIANTPCEKVFKGEICVYGQGVQTLFPLDTDLRKLEAESYIAVPMPSSSGQILGILVALDVKPFNEENLDVSLLLLFAGRAGAELERQRAEKENQTFQAQMLHSQKLESLGILAGGIAHDFNNILVGILGNTGLAQMVLPPDSKANEFLEKIEQAAQRAADLANQMLAYSGRGQFVIETVNLAKLVDNMADFLRTSISKKANLRFRFSENLPPIRADATQIRQVVMNLVTNASDALGEESGTITVRVADKEADESDLDTTHTGTGLAPGHYLCLKVSDTGSGMGQNTRAKIFDPFFTTKLTGRGLGMAAVLGIVRGHKGSIKVESTPGYGSIFTVLLPTADQVAEERYRAESGDAIQTMVPRGGKILVVDDEEVVREVARLSLESAGYEVITAPNGRDALAVFLREGNEIAAVVLDLTMPYMSGEEAFSELHRLKPDLRVVLTSGYNEQDVTSRFEGDGPSGFLKKPFRSKDLIRKVNQVLM